MFWNIFVVLLREKSRNQAFNNCSLVYRYRKGDCWTWNSTFKILIVRIIFTQHSVKAYSYNVTVTLNILRINLRTSHIFVHTWIRLHISATHKYFSNPSIKYDQNCEHSLTLKCILTNQSFTVQIKTYGSQQLLNTSMNIRTV